MAKETYKVDTKETLRKGRLVFPVILGLLWAACLFRFYHDKSNYLEFVASLGLFPAVFMSVVFLAVWLSLRNISYEISSVKVLKKRGDEIVCSIDLCDVQGVIAKEMITLKVSGRDDFLFRGIGTKESRERLLAGLRELGIREVEREKIKPVQVILIVATLLFIACFSGSVMMWVGFTGACLKYNRVGIDWPMLLHAIPAVVFLVMSAMAAWLVCKKKRGPVFLLVLIVLASVLCFLYENKNDFYQWEKGKYCTWWWYGLIDKPEEPVSNGYSETYYKYGYIDKTGNTVIEPKYDFAEDFSEGLACVGYRIKKEDADEEVVKRQSWRFDPNFPPFEFGEVQDSVCLYGFINTKGEVIVEPQFDSAKAFSEGMSLIGIGDKSGYINRSGKIVIELRSDWMPRDFSEGLAVVSVDEEYIFIDKQGEVAFPERFAYADGFSEGLAFVKVDGKRGYIDRTGQMIIKPRFDRARRFYEGMAAVAINDKWGFIDKTGSVVIEPQFGAAFGFHEGIVIVRIDGKWGLVERWGFIDNTGRIVIEPSLGWPTKFSRGLARVHYAKGWGYREKYWCEWIDKTGTVVNKPYFDKAYLFSEGLATVYIDDKWGFINQSGELVIEPQFDTADSFSEGLAAVGMETGKANIECRTEKF